MKVLFSHDIFVSQPHGGASRLFVGLHHALRERGVTSRICAGLHINSYLTRQRNVTGLHVGQGRSMALRSACGFCNAPFERAMRAAWRPSVYHLTYFPRRTDRVRSRVAVTVLDMIHELYPDQFPVQDQTSARKRHWSIAADLVFALSEKTKQDLVAQFAIPQEKVAVVYPGISPLRPDPTTDLRPYGDYLLYVGERGIPYKNFDGFVIALARSRAARDLQLVCFGGTALTRQERALLSGLGLLGQTHLVSGSDGQLASLYSGARALVYPSKYEGFGFPPLEAMSLGCPVVCSRGGSIREVVGDAALLFDPDDPDDIAAALDRIVTDECLRARLLASGAARVRDFTWDRAGLATLQAYERV